MKIISKCLIAVMAVLIAAALFSGCSEISENKEKNTEEYNIVCTFFAQYDWIKNITRGIDGINVSLLCDNGSDMHSYQMTAEDVLEIAGCDMLVAIGGESDEWAKEAATANHVEYISLTGLADITEHSHEHNKTQDSDTHSNEENTDEHVWLSPKKAKILVKKLSDIICESLPDKSDSITDLTQGYLLELDALDEKYTDICENSQNKVMVVADRFPFAHLAHDYEIECFSAFPGCSADTNAGFETIIELAKAVDSNSLKYIVVTENSDMKTSNAVIAATKSKNQQVCVLDSMQSVIYKKDSSVNYIDIMEKNLEVLEKVLSN